jgi:hypothetical protein
MPFKDKSRYQSEEWKEYQRDYQRSWYQRNKTKRLARIYMRKAATYKYVQEIKSHLCCADCGERHPATLQFHHLNSEDKIFNVADAVRDGLSLDRIRKEITARGKWFQRALPYRLATPERCTRRD